MADIFKCPFLDIACNVTASPGKTIAQVTNPSTQRFKPVEMTFSFDGVTATAVPVVVRLVRQTTAGTPSGNTTPTPIQSDPGGPAALQTLVVAGAAAWTAEPTVTDVLWQIRFAPTIGMPYQWPLGREDSIAASGRMGLVVWAAAAVNITGFIAWET